MSICYYDRTGELGFEQKEFDNGRVLEINWTKSNLLMNIVSFGNMQ